MAHSALDGLRLGSLEYEQIVEAFNLFISLYYSATPTENLLVDSLKLMQIELGLDSPILEADYLVVGYLVTKEQLQSL